MDETIVILSTADFNSAVWTNKQHLARRLAEHRRVIYIESIGLRRPMLSVADTKRIFSRLFRKKTRTAVPANIQIVKPHVIPLHGHKPIQAINAWLLRRQIRRITTEDELPSVLWTFSPVTYGIETYFSKVIYHSVDLLHTQPRVPTALLLDSEKKIIDVADYLIASSIGVAHHLQQMTLKPVRLWENVADTSLYIGANVPERTSKAVFAGNLTPTKIDFKLLTDLADTGIDLILAGPTAIDGTRTNQSIAKLIQHPHITHVGNLKPPELAKLLNQCTVGVIPYVVNDYTNGVYPMKVYEYLASGLAVVSTPLPSLAHVDDEDIRIVPRDAFVKTVVDSLTVDNPTVTNRKIRSKDHSWEKRTLDALALLDEK